MKNTNKKRRTVLVSSQKDFKGTSSASSNQFVRRDWCEFQDKHLFSRVELSKSLLKAFWTTKWPFLPLFRRLVKIISTFEIAVLCAAGDAQCIHKEVIGCFCDSLLTFVICPLYFFTFTLNYLFILLGIALRQIWLHGTARRAEQSFIL